ncbi:2-amino-4-hydroxy-6-hydroxymethyldihydropteridine diphosphokinase [Rubrolithibacter danxiaensis]|uniref:2-amino-4-hydroxy-6- hydroxymethyldihydropteridine diphosphokinase n=1 Tax=Rubrolithibacter danxiaensis TaxID=3390805 RepID=UPI003BF7C995
MQVVYLLFGSNLGDRETFLEQARKQVQLKIGKITGISSLYKTESWGKKDQPEFINQVVAVDSELKPGEILEKIISIEKSLGRTREEKWGSRTIDIDILFYGDEIINEPALIVPHPFLHERRFTLEPLMELQPKLFHPVLEKTIEEIYKDLPDNLQVRKID